MTGRLAVHCVHGLSRSASLLIASLILYRHQTVQDALKTISIVRPVYPNQGFLRQLCQLHKEVYCGKHDEGDLLVGDGGHVENKGGEKLK